MCPAERGGVRKGASIQAEHSNRPVQKLGLLAIGSAHREGLLTDPPPALGGCNFEANIKF